MAVLALDTSGPWVSVALWRDGEVTSQREEMARGQAEALFPLIDAVLARAGASYDTLSALGVGVGPGNFTGIRIAVASVRGLALSLGCPAFGVSSFDVMAERATRPVTTILDARMDRLYAQEWTPDPGPARLLDAAEAAALRAEGGPLCEELPDPAPVIAAIAARRFAAGERPVAPAPLYLRPADAAPSRDAPPVILSDG